MDSTIDISDITDFPYLIRYYVLGIVICPVVFYMPKFFELRTTYDTLAVPINCAAIMQPMQQLKEQQQQPQPSQTEATETQLPPLDRGTYLKRP